MGVLSCCDREPIDTNDCLKKCGGDVTLTAVLTITSIALMVIALLGTTGVISLNPHLRIGLMALGGSLGFLGSLGLSPDLDTTCRKTSFLILYLLSAAAVTVGALGISGHISALQGTTGTVIAGSGVIAMVLMSSTYSCRFPYKVLS
jgi:hypothetical protein